MNKLTERFGVISKHCTRLTLQIKIKRTYRKLIANYLSLVYHTYFTLIKDKLYLMQK